MMREKIALEENMEHRGLTSMMEVEVQMATGMMNNLLIKEGSVGLIRQRIWRHIRIHKILKKKRIDSQTSGYSSFGTS